MNKVKILSAIFGMTLMLMIGPVMSFQFANAQMTPTGGETIIAFNGDQTVSSPKFIGLGNTANTATEAQIVIPIGGEITSFKCSLDSNTVGTYTFELLKSDLASPQTFFPQCSRSGRSSPRRRGRRGNPYGRCGRGSARWRRSKRRRLGTASSCALGPS